MLEKYKMSNCKAAPKNRIKKVEMEEKDNVDINDNLPFSQAVGVLA